MENLDPEIYQLYKNAIKYKQVGDTYHAVKLFKRIIKLNKNWQLPYEELAQIYKSRQEWKPTLYYSKKAVSINSANQETWWNIGIAATALHKKRLARNVWNKFADKYAEPKTIAVKLQLNQQFEIIWGQRIDPARVVVLSVPFPNSSFRYKDCLLIDRHTSGHTLTHNSRVPVYESLGLHKRSHYLTHSCWLFNVDAEDIQILRNLCQEEEIGIEIWSNVVGNIATTANASGIEYGSADFLKFPTGNPVQVAIAAKRLSHVIRILDNWSVITLKKYDELLVHHRN